MNRREFTKSLAAATITPALPGKALALGASTVPEALFARAVKWAPVWHKSTAATFAKILKVDRTTAAEVFARLQQEGVISKPGADGFAYAAQPWFEDAKVAVDLSERLINAPLAQARAPLKRVLDDGLADKTAVKVEIKQDAVEYLDPSAQEDQSEDNTQPGEGEVLAE